MATNRKTVVILLSLFVGSVIMVSWLTLTSRPSRVYWLETSPGVQSAAYDVSNDGNTIVGYVAFQAMRPKPVLWRRQGNVWNIEKIPVPSGMVGTAFGVSPSGKFVVGTLTDLSTGGLIGYGFLWSQETGTRLFGPIHRKWRFNPQEIPTPSTIEGVYAVDDKGLILLGQLGNNRIGFWRLMHDGAYKEQIIQHDSSALSVLRTGYTRCMSTDGTLLGGQMSLHPVIWRYSRNHWKATLLDQDARGEVIQIAQEDKAIIAIGSIIRPKGMYAVRWTFREGKWLQQPLCRSSSRAHGATKDGRTVVGSIEQTRGSEPWTAFYWSEASGMVNLNDYFETEFKHWLAIGWLKNFLVDRCSVLIDAYGVSDDERYVVGYGYNARTGRMEAYIATLRP